MYVLSVGSLARRGREKVKGHMSRTGQVAPLADR